MPTGIKTRLPRCPECQRQMRPRRTRLDDYPGTVQMYDDDQCASCERRHRSGLTGPVTPRPDVPYVIAELQFLGDSDHPDRLAERMGFASGEMLVQALERHHERDMARILRRRLDERLPR